jgi:hypothetical protein
MLLLAPAVGDTRQSSCSSALLRRPAKCVAPPDIHVACSVTRPSPIAIGCRRQVRTTHDDGWHNTNIEVLPLLTGSPALGFGASTQVEAFDQRGLPGDQDGDNDGASGVDAGGLRKELDLVIESAPALKSTCRNHRRVQQSSCR